jgi:dUTP pyrophosphatase
LKVKIKRLASKNGYKVEIPEYATAGAAGLDLRACIDESVRLEAGEIKLVPTGIAIELPENHAAFVFGRSGLGVRHGITMANGVGVIDSDYRGEISCGLINLSDSCFTVEPGDRIAQLVIMPVIRAELSEEELGGTGRGDGGFGSTGRK